MEKTDLKEHIRKRPGMYFGSNKSTGIIYLLRNVLIESISMIKGEIEFTIVMDMEHKYSIYIDTLADTSGLINYLLHEADPHSYLYLSALMYVTEHFKIITKAEEYVFNDGELQSTVALTKKPEHTIEIQFSFLQNVFVESDFDYSDMAGSMSELALLNRNTGIILKDLRHKHINQNYFSYPEGINRVYEKLIQNKLPLGLTVSFDGELNKNSYQFSLTYLHYAYPTGCAISYANDIKTIYGGTHVDGIIEGTAAACKKYAASKGLTYRVTRKKLLHGLVIVCAARVDNPEYYGSTKEQLANAEVKKELKKITEKLVYEKLCQDSAFLENHYLYRFDDSKPMSKIY